MVDATPARPKDVSRIPSVYHFDVSNVTPYFVHASTYITGESGARSFCGVLRMPRDQWASFISVIHAGAKVLGDRWEVKYTDGNS